MLKRSLLHANVRDYIADNYDGSNYNYTYTTNFSAIRENIVNTFMAEKVKNDNRRLDSRTLFHEWCSGLPSILDTCYYYNRSAIADVEKITGENKERARKYTERDAENYITDLIYNELFYMHPIKANFPELSDFLHAANNDVIGYIGTNPVEINGHKYTAEIYKTEHPFTDAERDAIKRNYSNVNTGTARPQYAPEISHGVIFIYNKTLSTIEDYKRGL